MERLTTVRIACVVALMALAVPSQAQIATMDLTKPAAATVLSVPLAVGPLPPSTHTVDVYQGTVRAERRICHVLTPPWACVWSTDAVGTWLVYFVARDVSGTQGQTTAVRLTIAVVAPPPPPPPSAGLEVRTLVVANTLFPPSSVIAERYRAARGLPEANLCAFPVPWPAWTRWDDTRTLADYQTTRAGIRACVDRVGRAQVLYLVLTPGIPFYVWDGQGRSLDSLLSVLWDDALGVPMRRGNPYSVPLNLCLNCASSPPEPFISWASWRDARPEVPTYSVWRLWGARGAEVETATAQIDAGLAVEAAGGLRGWACFDAYESGVLRLPATDASIPGTDNALIRAAELTRDAGLPTLLDGHREEFGTAPAPLRCEGAAFYAGWYSYGRYNDAFSWVPGAIGWHLDSYSRAWAEGALLRGLAVSSGHVAEPGLQAAPRPDGVVRELLTGANVGDAFRRHTAWDAWMTVQYGDPLYRPFPKGHP